MSIATNTDLFAIVLSHFEPLEWVNVASVCLEWRNGTLEAAKATFQIPGFTARNLNGSLKALDKRDVKKFFDDQERLISLMGARILGFDPRYAKYPWPFITNAHKYLIDKKGKKFGQRKSCFFVMQHRERPNDFRVGQVMEIQQNGAYTYEFNYKTCLLLKKVKKGWYKPIPCTRDAIVESCSLERLQLIFDNRDKEFQLYTPYAPPERTTGCSIQ